MSPRTWDLPGPGDENAPAEMERSECHRCFACDGCSRCEGHGYLDGERECAACEGTGCEESELEVAEHERCATRGDDEAWRAQMEAP